MSSLKPQLDAHDVRLVGIGLEEIGVQEFVQGKFLDGDLYIDTKKQSYQDLGFQRMSFFSVITKLFSRIARQRYSEATKLGGDMKGDGLQNGGTIIVEKGGKILLKYIQENPADHVALADVLKALNIGAAEGASSSK